MKHINNTYTLDLHGLRKNEAKPLLQETIDRCFFHGYTSIKVICGHGTGTLMSMVISEHLKSGLVKPCGQDTYSTMEKGYILLELEENKA